jgi:hypothetical protein
MRAHSLLFAATLIAALAAPAAAIPPGPRAQVQLNCTSGRAAFNSNVLTFTFEVQTPNRASVTGAGAGNSITYSQVSVDLPAVQAIALFQAEVNGTTFKTCDLIRGSMDITFNGVHVDDVKLTTSGLQDRYVTRASFDYATMSITDGTTNTGSIATEPLWSQVIFAATVATVPIF